MGALTNEDVEMNDIDWSKAPEGAQYYSASDDGFYTFYREIKDSTYEIFYCGGTRWILHVGTPEEHCTSIPRPTPAWNGEGFPPVGAVCEMHHDAWQPNNWPKVTVKYASAEYFITEDGAGEQHWHARSVKFRPIRTHEQIAADEREAAIDQMINDATNPMDEKMLFRNYPGTAFIRQLAECLYNAGYRKP